LYSTEGANLAAIILIASLHNRKVHICHVSRKDEIEIIKAAKEKGLQVTCEVTPHHLFFTQEDIDRLGEKFSKVAPRLLPEEHRQALWEK
jgi:carbamoyl-phosphate synthase/aspartate carbamoyltransferase/dihydroorotase